MALSDSAKLIASLRAATDLPISWCRKWVADAPRELVDRLASGEDYIGVILDLRSRGIDVPCPICGAPIVAFAVRAYCPQGCRRFGWIASTTADRAAVDRAVSGGDCSR